MTMAFKELKEQYPNPVMSAAADLGFYLRGDWTGSYCVGGAFCAGQGIPERFPEPDDLGLYLQEFNNNLSEEVAVEFGYIISDLNDDGDFDGAWAALEQAMSYTVEPGP